MKIFSLAKTRMPLVSAIFSLALTACSQANSRCDDAAVTSIIDRLAFENKGSLVGEFVVKHFPGAFIWADAAVVLQNMKSPSAQGMPDVRSTIFDPEYLKMYDSFNVNGDIKAIDREKLAAYVNNYFEDRNNYKFSLGDVRLSRRNEQTKSSECEASLVLTMGGISKQRPIRYIVQTTTNGSPYVTVYGLKD